jgi:hypothetical protein
MVDARAPPNYDAGTRAGQAELSECRRVGLMPGLIVALFLPGGNSPTLEGLAFTGMTSE